MVLHPARNGLAPRTEKQSHRLPADVFLCGVFLVKNNMFHYKFKVAP
jgi:hypothetical protein